MRSVNRRRVGDDIRGMTTPSSPTSLTEFAAAQGSGPRPRCLLCNVPLDVEQQAQQGHAAKIPYRVICQWLESLNADHGKVTKGRIERHFHESHQHPDAAVQEAR